MVPPQNPWAAGTGLPTTRHSRESRKPVKYRSAHQPVQHPVPPTIYQCFSRFSILCHRYSTNASAGSASCVTDNLPILRPVQHPVSPTIDRRFGRFSILCRRQSTDASAGSASCAADNLPAPPGTMENQSLQALSDSLQKSRILVSHAPDRKGDFR